MSQLTDAELLHQAADGSRPALGEIARRYVGFVYGTALRQLHDRHLAEDVTQSVFLILSRKIMRMDRGALLHGWFYTTTRYATANAIKTMKRRNHHERAAAEMNSPITEATSDDATPLLDEALANLRQIDRSAVLLSYFGGRSWREVGEAMGTSEDAARKRVERAIDRMRSFMSQRGIALSATGVAGAMEQLADASSAPPGLVESIASSVAIAPVSGIAGVVAQLATWTKIKLAGTALAIVVAAIGATGVAMLQGSATTVAASADSFVAELDHGAKVEFRGMARYPSVNEPWWLPDGSATERVYFGSEPDPNQSSGNREIILRITGPTIDNMGVKIALDEAGGWTTGVIRDLPDCRLLIIDAGDRESTDIRITLATGEWETIVAQNAAGVQAGSQVVFGEAVDQNGGSVISVSDDLIDQQARVIAIGQDGSQREPIGLTMGMTMTFRQLTVRFDMPVAEIDRFEFQARPFDQWVQFNNVSLVPGKSAGFQLDSGRVDPKSNPSDGKK